MAERKKALDKERKQNTYKSYNAEYEEDLEKDYDDSMEL